jgi:hypothetical protein
MADHTEAVATVLVIEKVDALMWRYGPAGPDGQLGERFWWVRLTGRARRPKAVGGYNERLWPIVRVLLRRPDSQNRILYDLTVVIAAERWSPLASGDG